MGTYVIMKKKTIHIILKWNEAAVFHSEAPDTILAHCQILKAFNKTDKYVWWGKVSVSGYLGLKKGDVESINLQIKEGIQTYIFLYCPDKPLATMHVGRLEEVTIEDKSRDIHTPSYYQDLIEKHPIPFWFKISDITELPISNILKNLEYEDGRIFDPVSVNFYPQKVFLKSKENYFLYSNLYEHILEGKMMRCFKTGGACTRVNEKELKLNPNQVFIGCPFKKEYFNMVKYVIKPVCNELGYSTWIANEQFKNIDIMCKVCGGIQSSARAIIDITKWNANVLFELGLLYGLGKNVVLIKHDESDPPVDLQGIAYVDYDMNDFDDAKKIIKSYMEG